MQYMLLKDVSRQTYGWKILVRFARIWEFRDQQTGAELYEIDFVVVDQQGGTMEGCIPKNRIGQFKGQLKEGSVYILEQFVLSDAKKVYKSVEHPYRIKFTLRTRMTEVLAVPENFPVYAYSARSFGVLATRVNNNTLLSDVVGLVTAVTEVSTAHSTQQYKRQVFLTDGSERAVVTLWGNHAEAFQAADIKMQSEHKPMVVLFVGMTVSKFSGMLAFKSTSVTKWYMNIPIPQVVAVREATRDQSHQIQDQGLSRPKGEPTDIALSTLISSAPYDRIGDRFNIKVQLIDLVTKYNWWYLSCKSCWKKLQPEGIKYRCPRCLSEKGEPRYKVVYAGIDLTSEGQDEPVIGHFNFLGQVGVALIGKDEALLVPEPSLLRSSTPACLLEPIGKKYALTVELSDSSLDSDNLCFQVNASEELRPQAALEHDPESPLCLNVTSSAAAIEQVTPGATSSSGISSEKIAVGTPPDKILADIASKTRSIEPARKRGATPVSRSNAKKGRVTNQYASKQLSFEGEQASMDMSRSKDNKDN